MILRSLFSDSLKDHAACYVVSFGDHVSYLRVSAPIKDVQGTVYFWAEGASLTCLEFEQYRMFLNIYGACSVFHNDTFGLKGDIGYC